MSRSIVALTLLAVLCGAPSVHAQTPLPPAAHGAVFMTLGRTKAGPMDANVSKLVSVQLAVFPNPTKPLCGVLNITQGAIERGTISQVFLGARTLSTSYTVPVQMEGGLWWDSQKMKSAEPEYISYPYTAYRWYARSDGGAYVSGIAAFPDRSQAAILVRIGSLVSLDLQASYTAEDDEGFYFRSAFIKTISSLNELERLEASSTSYGGSQSLAFSHVQRYQLIDIDVGHWDKSHRYVGFVGILFEKHELEPVKESFLGLCAGGFASLDDDRHIQASLRLEALSGGNEEAPDDGSQDVTIERYSVSLSYNF